MKTATLTAVLLCLLCYTAHARRTSGKAGPLMLNLKPGASIPIYLQDYNGTATDVLPASFALQAEAGVALGRDRNAYVVLPFEFHVSQRTQGGGLFSARATYARVAVPLGFQYDIAIPNVPGLYVYPRLSFGYAALIISGSVSAFGGTLSGDATYHGGMLTPELGVKYVVGGRLNLGLEPFGLPVHFFDTNNGVKVVLDYRLHAYVGVNL